MTRPFVDFARRRGWLAAALLACLLALPGCALLPSTDPARADASGERPAPAPQRSDTARDAPTASAFDLRVECDDAELRTPVFSLVGYSEATFSYLANYQNFSGIDRLNFDISADGGVTWTTLTTWNSDQGAFQSTPGARRERRASVSPYIHMPGFGFAENGTCTAWPQMVSMSYAATSFFFAASRNASPTFLG